MFDSTQTNPGEWFDCLNVGDDYEDKADRRKDADLTIPGFSLVEIVGVRALGSTSDNESSEDRFVFEVRLPMGEVAPGQTEATDAKGVVPKYVTMGCNFAFTGPASIAKLRQGRVKFAPALCRFEGNEADTLKIFGRYKAPKRSLGGKYTNAQYDLYEEHERLFGQGIQQQLIGDPKGHLKLPNDLTKASKFRLQFQMLGWSCLGIYKHNTGAKTKGKKDDKDPTKNLLAYVAPAAQIAPGTPVRFITHEPYSTYTTRTYGSDTYDLDGDIRTGQKYAVMVDGETRVPASLLYYDPDGNHKQMITFQGDGVSGSIKLILEGQSTGVIPIGGAYPTEASLKAELESLPNIGAGNVEVSVWPGHWLIEFVNDLAGVSFDLFEVDLLNDAVFDCFSYETMWADAGMDADILFPIPLEGEYDGDDYVINDALAPGTIGIADWFPGIGFVANAAQCRSYNGDGSPDL